MEIKASDVSVLVCYPDAPDERGTKIAYDVDEGETVAELLLRLLGRTLDSPHSWQIPHIVVELRAKAKGQP